MLKNLKMIHLGFLFQLIFLVFLTKHFWCGFTDFLWAGHFNNASNGISVQLKYIAYKKSEQIYAIKVYEIDYSGLHYKNIMTTSMTNVSDAPSCGATYDRHSDD